MSTRTVQGGPAVVPVLILLGLLSGNVKGIRAEAVVTNMRCFPGGVQDKVVQRVLVFLYSLIVQTEHDSVEETTLDHPFMRLIALLTAGNQIGVVVAVSPGSTADKALSLDR